VASADERVLGATGEARPKTHHFRSQLELRRRLRAFRERYGVTQNEFARSRSATARP
jgi:hypothetical protein